ncbi:MAG TPA: NIPSNAP family protein [Gemmatimonadaceae bacterium]|nr:NIPSNAP family protein [Gemmatimonadaceae bacterium]
MIVERNVFRLKFGAAREAVALWQEGLTTLRNAGATIDARLLTDLTGPYYTLVLELTHESLAAMETAAQREMDSPEWKAWYRRFVPLVESGYREIFTLVASAAPSLPGAEMGARAAGTR